MNNLSMQEYMPFKKIVPKKDPFVFGMSEKPNGEKNKDKMVMYHDFIWKINYSNGLYIKASNDEEQYSAYIGKGNNCCMVKSILKRRPWWTIV